MYQRGLEFIHKKAEAQKKKKENGKKNKRKWRVIKWSSLNSIEMLWEVWAVHAGKHMHNKVITQLQVFVEQKGT